MSLVSCAHCNKAITKESGGVYVSHGSIRTAFCGVECHTSLCCRLSDGTKPIPLAAPSGPLAKNLGPPPRRKTALQAEARFAKRTRGDESSDDEEEEDDERNDASSSVSSQPAKARETLGPYPSPGSGRYAEILALAKPLFAKFPRLRPERLDTSSIAPLTIDDLVGLVEEKAILHSSLIGTMKVPTLANHINLSIPGVLLYGPGGTGKTSLVQAIARQTGYSLFVPPSSSIVDQYIGNSGKAFRSAYYSAVLEAYAAEEGLAGAPRGAIFFLDEGDELLKKSEKADTDTGIASEFKQIVQDSKKIPRFVIIVATNLPDTITDSAVLSRLPLKLYIGPPTVGESVKLATDEVQRFYDAADEPCKAAQRKAFTELMQGLTTDHALRDRLARRLEGHVPREIRQMVNIALAPNDPRGLVGTTFCPLPDNPSVYRAVDTGGAKPKGCVSAIDLDRRLMEDQTLAVCWIVPTAEKFVEKLISLDIKKSFTPIEIERFLHYAREELIDEKGAKRLDEALKRALAIQDRAVQAMNVS